MNERPATKERPAAVGARRPTSLDVALRAGVSQSAVSRAFTEGSSISEDLRRRVMEAAKKLNYTPNYAARSLVTSRSSIVGVAMSHLDNHFYPEVLELLSREFAAAGYQILLFITGGEETAEQVLQQMLRFRVEGMVLAARSQSAWATAEFARHGLPVVMLNNVAAGSRISGVCGDNLRGGATVAAFLLAGGHRRLAYIRGIDTNLAARDREFGFRQFLAEVGAPEPLSLGGDFDFNRTSEVVRELLRSAQPPDAIFCANDQMALTALQVAAGEFGLTPGRELSIVGFDNVAIGAWPLLRLTSYSQPVGEIVRRTVDTLLRAIGGDNSSPRPEFVAGNLIVRRSARRPTTGIVVASDGQEIWQPPAAAGAVIDGLSPPQYSIAAPPVAAGTAIEGFDSWADVRGEMLPATARELAAQNQMLRRMLTDALMEKSQLREQRNLYRIYLARVSPLAPRDWEPVSE